MTDKLNSATNPQAPPPNSAPSYAALKAALQAIHFKALALAAFIELFVTVCYSSSGRRKSAGAADAASLRRFLHVPGRQFRATPVPKLTVSDVEDLCKALAGVTIPGTDRFYADSTYNRPLGALSRLLEFLSQPPWSLIPQLRVQLMIAAVKNHMMPEIPRCHGSLLPAREEFITRSAQPRIDSVLTGLKSQFSADGHDELRNRAIHTIHNKSHQSDPDDPATSKNPGNRSRFVDSVLSAPAQTGSNFLPKSHDSSSLAAANPFPTKGNIMPLAGALLPGPQGNRAENPTAATLKTGQTKAFVIRISAVEIPAVIRTKN